MKKGKIILGAAATIVTIGTGGVKAITKNGIHYAFGATRKGSIRCLRCNSLWISNFPGGHQSRCHSTPNGVKTLWATKTIGPAAHTWAWRTAVTAVNHTKCGSVKATSVTIVQ